MDDVMLFYNNRLGLLKAEKITVNPGSDLISAHGINSDGRPVVWTFCSEDAREFGDACIVDGHIAVKGKSE